MTRTIAIQQRKGGAAKSTTAAEVVLALSRAGRKVLAIDVDEARAFSIRMGFSAYQVPEMTSREFLEGAELGECVTDSPAIEGVQVVQGGPGLDDLSDMSVTALRDVLPHERGWDVAVVDTPGDYGRGTSAAIAAAEVVIVPVPAEVESLLTLDRMTEWRAEIARRLRRRMPGQEVWYMPVKIDSRQTVDRDLIEVLTQRYPGRVTTPVRKVGTSATKATGARLPVGLYAPEDGVAVDYRAALAPILASF